MSWLRQYKKEKWIKEQHNRPKPTHCRILFIEQVCGLHWCNIGRRFYS